MIFRWESDCSLSSTHRIVRFGFISLRDPLGELTARVRIQQKFSRYEEWQSEMNANEKRARCKVPAMLMRLSGYCFCEQRLACSVFGSAPHVDHRKNSPRITSTALPPTRTLTIRLSRFAARTKILLGRCISMPCSISTLRSGSATPCATIQAAVQPAAEPVAGSSPLYKIIRACNVADGST